MKNDMLSTSEAAGFTIIELMIATAVLSTILLLATLVMTSIGTLYDKGVNQARVQDDTRSITDQLSQNLKYDTATVPVTTGSGTAQLNGQTVNVYAFCIGSDIRYSYVLGYKIGSGSDTLYNIPQSPDVLWVDNPNDSDVLVTAITPGSSCAPVNVTIPGGVQGPGSELIAPDSRLTAFCVGTIDLTSPSADPSGCVDSTASPYNITVEVAFGDIDLLNGSFQAQQKAPLTAGHQDDNVTCNGNIGSQFCSTAVLNTVVAQRTTGD